MIDEAITDPNAVGGGFLAGYDGELHLGALALLLARLILALYLLSSALAAYDRKALRGWEIVLRLVLAVLVMFKAEMVYIVAAGLAILHLADHVRRARHA